MTMWRMPHSEKNRRFFEPAWRTKAFYLNYLEKVEKKT